MAVKLKITLRKSPIGYDSSHRATARALGFTKLQQVRVHDDNKVIRPGVGIRRAETADNCLYYYW